MQAEVKLETHNEFLREHEELIKDGDMDEKIKAVHMQLKVGK